LLRRAEYVPIRVISADSRQVYRHMDIGTGKPTLAELAVLPHFGIDLIDPGEAFSAHAFVLMAANALRGLEEFAGEIWVCGGTGLYIRALCDALPLGSPPRPALRQALMERIAEVGPERVSNDLHLPQRERENPVRVLRYAEYAAAGADGSRVYEYAGLPTTLLLTDVSGESESTYSTALAYLQDWTYQGVIVLDPGAELEERIRRRVQFMFRRGLVDEVKRLRQLGYGQTDVVRLGIGYMDAGALLDHHFADEATAIHWSIIRTRQYAKRQRTYFRGRGWPVYQNLGDFTL
jgi:tRNA dimethylallyltransferase